MQSQSSKSLPIYIHLYSLKRKSSLKGPWADQAIRDAFVMRISTCFPTVLRLPGHPHVLRRLRALRPSAAASRRTGHTLDPTTAAAQADGARAVGRVGGAEEAEVSEEGRELHWSSTLVGADLQGVSWSFLQPFFERRSFDSYGF